MLTSTNSTEDSSVVSDKTKQPVSQPVRYWFHTGKLGSCTCQLPLKNKHNEQTAFCRLMCLIHDVSEHNTTLNYDVTKTLRRAADVSVSVHQQRETQTSVCCQSASPAVFPSPAAAHLIQMTSSSRSLC